MASIKINLRPIENHLNQGCDKIEGSLDDLMPWFQRLSTDKQEEVLNGNPALVRLVNLKNYITEVFG